MQSSCPRNSQQPTGNTKTKMESPVFVAIDVVQDYEFPKGVRVQN